MIQKLISNPCSRCGNERIVTKTWTEQIGNSLVTHTDTICSNPDCQKRVEADIEREKAKRDAFKKESLEKEKERKDRIARLAESRRDAARKIISIK